MKRDDSHPNLLYWYSRNGRPLPWRKTGDPYLIWVSEIIMQQTRVVQGTPYYNKFIERFPDIYSIAKAELSEVIKYWEGLGYYARVRNIYKTAQIIVREYNGKFPEEVQMLEKLPGIGPYTARAIASFAFGKKVAVLDGNIYRILSRVYADDYCIDQASARKYFQEIADRFMNQAPSADFNQAMMDLGALVCKPFQPLCKDCPLNISCMAFTRGNVEAYPVRKPKSIRPKKKGACHFIVNPEGKFYIRQRNHKGLWGGLFELPWYYKGDLPEIIFQQENQKKIGYIHHVFTHFELELEVLVSFVSEDCMAKDAHWIGANEINNYTFPRAMHKIFHILRNKEFVK